MSRTDEMWWIIAFGVIAVIVVAIIGAIADGEKKQAVTKYIETIPDFAAQFVCVASDNTTALAIDDSAKRLCLVVRQGAQLLHRVIPYGELIASEVHEDGHVVSTASRSSQVAGAVVGGVLLGGVGAAVGALSGKRKETGRVSRVELRLMVESMALPTHTVAFQSIETERNGVVHAQASRLARDWQSRMESVIRQAERDPAKVQQQGGLDQVSANQPTT